MDKLAEIKAIIEQTEKDRNPSAAEEVSRRYGFIDRIWWSMIRSQAYEKIKEIIGRQEQ